eukprot:11028647-Karenia_brevis.AAC.1
MEAESATGVNQTSFWKSSRCGGPRAFQASLQVSMKAESATGINQTRLWRSTQWGAFRILPKVRQGRIKPAPGGRAGESLPHF